MEWAGWIAMIMLLYYSSYPGKVNKLECKVKKLERKQGGKLDCYEVEVIKIYGETLRNGLYNSDKVKIYKPFSTTQSIEDGQLTI